MEGWGRGWGVLSYVTYTGMCCWTGQGMVFVLSVLNRVYNVHDLCDSVLITCINRLLGPKQGTKIEGVVLNRVCMLGIFLS